MIVPAAALAPGLSPSRAPDPSSVPDNHLAYAVQWFAFAAMAIVIYAFALRRRR
jgi:cytochrome oxidase assembly protein ShyY1